MSLSDMAWVWANSETSGVELLVMLAVADGSTSPSSIAQKARVTLVKANQICDELIGRGDLLWQAGALRVNTHER